MKHKVGDKVRVKSKEWWDAQPKNSCGSVKCGADVFNERMTCMCGNVVEISGCDGKVYSIKEDYANWTDEMFDGSYNQEKSIISEEMIKDIAEVIKKHNLGVSISENDGKLIIEPLKVEEEEDLPIDTPCMCGNSNNEIWSLRYYAFNGKVFSKGLMSPNNEGVTSFEYIIPFDKFNPIDLVESLKYNIVKQ